jgi:hypothetical protein
MPRQRNQYYRVIPYACANYNRLCKKHGIIPTPADVHEISRVIGPVSVQTAIQHRFEAALLFFLSRSTVRFKEDSLLIGWMYEDDETKREVWYNPNASGRSPLYHVAGGVASSRYSPKGSACDEWLPVISDIIDPGENKNRVVHYACFKACIKLLQAAVPPPSIENPRSAPNDSASTSSATPIPNGHPQETTITPQFFPEPSGRENSSMVDLTASEEEVIVKPEASTPAPINHIQAPSTQIEERIQAFRDKLDNRDVEELQHMLEKQLPSWIKKLAEDVLQKKMLKELDLAESYLL